MVIGRDVFKRVTPATGLKEKLGFLEAVLTGLSAEMLLGKRISNSDNLRVFCWRPWSKSNIY